MDILDIRKQMKMRSFREIPLRVTYYARVSTESDDQLNSLENQVSYYESLIKNNKFWTFIPGYIDEGLSAITTRKRRNFNQMIDDAKNGIFDLILTKEISRFARNTVDSLINSRELLQHGVGVFFENDGINTLDDDSELRLAMMSAIAQDELRKLSSRVRFGHQQAIKSGVVLGNSRIFGYSKESGHLVIDESQAEMVRELFQLYATDQYSMKQLESYLWDKGFRNYNGKKIAHSTLSGIISNPKYKGYYVGNKVRIVDMFTKKQKFLPPDEWVMFKDETGEVVPAIVSEDLWNKANEILSRRSEDVKGRQGVCNHPNLLTGKMFCTACGRAFYRRESKDKSGHKNSKWVCSGKINNGASSCATFPIYETEITPILYDVLMETQVDVESLINEYLEAYSELISDTNIQKKIDVLNNKITNEERKRRKLLDYNVSGKISDTSFVSMNSECEQVISEAMREISTLEEQKNSQHEFQKRMNEVRETLRVAKQDAQSGMVSKEFVNRYIDKIFVTMEDDHTARLGVKIFTGKTTEKLLKEIEVRSGHTFKKMTTVRSYTCNRRDRIAYNHSTKYSYIAKIILSDVQFALN